MCQHVCQVSCSQYHLQSLTSHSNEVEKPQDSRICVFHASNTSSEKNACVALLTTLISISQCPKPTNINTSCNNSASLMPSDAAITSASQLINAIDAWPHYEHAISWFPPWSLHHQRFSVSLDHSPSQSLFGLPIVRPFVLFCHGCHASQTLLTCLLCFWRT